MNHATFAGCLDCAPIHLPHGTQEAAARPWTPHPRFPGVELKLLVSGRNTEGALSCHLVRVQPGCALESHVHEGQWELHEVAAGRGRAELPGGTVDYAPGVMAVIPAGAGHAVHAGPEGLTLLAKFFPALA
jgi:quercetin dioxygenase-like cupin family protein